MSGGGQHPEHGKGHEMEQEVKRNPVAANLSQRQTMPIAAASRMVTGTVIPRSTQALCQGRVYS